MTLHKIPITSVKGIGPAKAEILKSEAAIETVEDLLYYIPRKYLDWSRMKKISDCYADEEVTVSGTVRSVRIIHAKRKMLNVEIEDSTGTLKGVFFGGIAFLQKKFQPGDTVLFSGKVGSFRGRQIVHPEFDFIDSVNHSRNINTAGIIPLYRSSENLKKHGFDSRGFRRVINEALESHLESVKEPLGSEILSANSLMGLKDALSSIHYPESFESAESARRRLAFNEVFFLHAYLELSRNYIKAQSGKEKKNYNSALTEEFIAGLDFRLTSDQEDALEQICGDITSPSPMNRLLQGDVGSGKTVVALASSLLPVSAGEQVAFMAPTEVLARQHFETAKKLIGPGARVSILTGSMKQKEKDELYEKIEKGETDIIIGTHALIQGSVNFQNLSYIIIDEQHRFGVEQRAKLRHKGKDTDLLVMTATPIPRTLSMTLYGDLDITNIRMKPADRLPVKTLAFSESEIGGVYRSINKYVKLGRQVYYILPLIEESEKIDLKSATETYEKLKNVFPDLQIDLMHGRLRQDEKDRIMNSFTGGETDILVSTTVIEVGIDVPNASVIVIEHAERFGLSQLHQLRGRVGRGRHQSFCVLISPDGISPEAGERVKIMTGTDDGFEISEKDLLLRGSGQLVGTRQHGNSDFEFTDLARDYDIIKAAREEAKKMILPLPDIDDFDSENRVIPERLLQGIRSRRILAILS